MSKYHAWKSFEGEVTRDLKPLGFDSRRNWNSQFIQKDGCDVIATDGETELVIQCKYGLKPDMRKGFNEAVTACTNKKAIPMAITRQKGSRETLVTMRWSDLKKKIKGEW